MTGVLWLAGGILLFGLGFTVGRVVRADEVDAAYWRGITDGRRAVARQVSGMEAER